MAKSFIFAADFGDGLSFLDRLLREAGANPAQDPLLYGLSSDSSEKSQVLFYIMPLP